MAIRPHSWASGIVATCLSLGCSGEIEAPTAGAPGNGTAATGGSGAGSGTGGSGSGATGTGGTGAGAGGGTPGVFSPSPSRLRRLTSIEYANSVIDLLGPGTVVTVELEKDIAQNNLTALAASSIALSAPITEQFETSALALSDALVRDTTRRQAVVGCTPTGATDEACLTSFVTTFGRRAFRRPLTPEEVDLYVGVGRGAMMTLADFWGGVRFALAGLLQSPNFLYRAEVGISDAATPGKRALDGYELATRLSYLFWATTPDDALLDAAGAGGLSTTAGLTTEIARLVASPRSHDSIVRILSEMLRLGELDALPQLPDVFPQAGSATLGASMRAETQGVLRELVFGANGDYREFFTTRQTMLNAELADLYGVSGPTGTDLVAIALPADGPRAGYLGQASFLALNAHSNKTSPTHRGKFILESLLCSSIPPPPNDVVAELPENDQDKTLREQLEVHQQDPVCGGCHSQMDSMGLALEHFDGIGAYRETDRGMTLDVTGVLDEVAFDGARELGQVLADGLLTPEGTPRTADCLVRTLFRAATGHLEGAGDQPIITELASAFAAGGFRVQGALEELAQSEGFRFVGEPE
jgi:hypothetical protein